MAHLLSRHAIRASIALAPTAEDTVLHREACF